LKLVLWEAPDVDVSGPIDGRATVRITEIERWPAEEDVVIARGFRDGEKQWLAPGVIEGPPQRTGLWRSVSSPVSEVVQGRRAMYA
jgi:hypothetical protein